MNAREWTVRISDLARRESSALVDLLLAVAEFDAQEGYRQLGFSSLFDFLHRKIGLSRGSAHYRQVGARLVRRFPEVAGPLRTGQLCITTVSELAKVMTEENRAEVLLRFFGCSRQEAKQLVAELRPVERPPARTVVTEIPLPVRETVQAEAAPAIVQPGATDEQVLTAALEALIEKQSKRRACVPPKVKREVMKRDEGKCTWPLADGGVCGSEVGPQVDHVVPRGRGGPSTADNCRILCQSHNLEAAREVYGDEVMDLFTQGKRWAGGTVAREGVATYGRWRCAAQARNREAPRPCRGVPVAPD